jgi:phospholipid/cholesterol/gamma-HCH transport system substrate-binding protein
LSVGSTTGDYPLIASFRSAEGISLGTDVRLAGVKIGSVTSLDLNRETFRADVTVSVETEVTIPEDSSIAVSSEGLLGGSFVEIIPGGSLFNLEPGGEIEDTQGAVSLIGLLSKFVSGNAE